MIRGMADNQTKWSKTSAIAGASIRIRREI
jgi:hypothetical protein